MKKMITSLLLLIMTLPTAAAESTSGQFITLGTAAGPIAEVERSQPANALVIGDDVYLVDAGDGANNQRAKAGLLLENVRGLFISHLHFDHTGGVLALLGLRMQTNVPQMLEIYGPPGTKRFIDGLLEGMDPAMKAAYGLPGQTWPANLNVTELVDGSSVELPGASVSVRENSHYIAGPELPDAEGYISLSFRFNLADRSITYTGDTGPSEAVIELAVNTDVLVSEMMDIPLVLAGVQRSRPDVTPQMLAGIEAHFTAHHVTPEQVGQMAAAANVTELVITHFTPSIRSQADERKYRNIIREFFDGEIIFASDLDRF